MRELCFAALMSTLADDEEMVPCGGGKEVIPPSLSVIARAVNAAPATLYNWWGAGQGAQTVSRWAGPDQAVKPSIAFAAEAKVVSFWPYRSGCLRVADAFDLSLTELACAYYRTLAVWTADRAALASCRPTGPPGCAAEDLAVIARHAPLSVLDGQESVAGRLTVLAGQVVAAILRDASLTPAGALDGVREEMTSLLAPPPGRLADRVEAILTELADRMLHGDDALTHAQAGQIRQAMARVSVAEGLRP